MNGKMATGNLKIAYTWQGDYLSVWNNLKGPVKAHDITSATILTAFHSPNGKCRGFDLFDAAQMLLPFFTREISKGELYNRELTAEYDAINDSLKLISNRHAPTHSETIANGFTAYCAETGWAIGFTLERAAATLMPYLKTWRPWTAAEQAAIQKRMAPQ